MEWVETTGRSVEEAKEAALDELGVDEQDAEFEIVAEARLGLFGRLRLLEGRTVALAAKALEGRAGTLQEGLRPSRSMPER